MKTIDQLQGEKAILVAKRKDIEKQIRAVESAIRTIRNANALTIQNRGKK